MKNLLIIGLTILSMTVYGQTTKTILKMNKKSIEIYDAFLQGMASGTDSWKDFISEDIKFEGPVDQVNGKENFIKLNEAFMPAIRGNEIKQVTESGNWVITQIVMDVAMPSGNVITLDMCEWYEIQDGKIQSVKIYYDAEEFRREMMSKG